MNIKRVLGLAGLLFACFPFPLRAWLYDPAEDFTIVNGNPNGVWSYGWMTTAFTGFTRFTNSGMGANGVNPIWYGWGSNWTPAVYKNRTSSSYYGTPTNALALHPGDGNQPAVLRWTAQKAGPLSAIGAFLPGDSGVMQVGVRHNTNWLFQASNAGSFTSAVTVARGDVIDFVVYGGYSSGTTPLLVTLEGPPPERTLYVDAASASPAPPYASWETAATAIQDALALAEDHDTVLVRDGTYASGGAAAPGAARLNRVCATNLVTIRSLNGPDRTVIRGDANARCAYLSGGARLEGFTLQEGATAAVGDPADAAGGGVCAASGTVARCIVRGNTAATGGGLYLAAGAAAENCLVTGNASDGAGGGACLEPGARMVHCTVAANSAGGSGGGVFLNAGGAVSRSILYANSAADGANWSAADGVFDAVCTAPTNGLPNAAGCLEADPGFLPADNFRLPPASPCVDALPATDGLDTDLAGMPRVADGDGDGFSASDFGCYERWVRAPFLAALDENAQLYVADWNAVSNAFVRYRLVANWRKSEGVGANTRSIAIADFNGDGHDDIAIGRYQMNQSHGFALLLNDGTNGFTRQEAAMLNVMAEDWAMAMTAGDFDLDGRADLLVQGNTGSLTFFKGDGAGRFTGRIQDGFEWRSRGLDTADFNGDGTNDLVRAAHSSGNLRYYAGLGDGSFGSYAQIADVGDDPYAVTAGDFNLDGLPDVLVNAGSSGDMRLFRGNGNGTFAAGQLVPSLDINRHSACDAFDFDGDGDLDVVSANYDGRAILFFRNDGSGTNFAAAVTVGTTPNNCMAIAAPPHTPLRPPPPAAAPTGAPPAVASSQLLYGEADALDGAWPITLAGSDLASDPDNDLTAFDWDSGDARSATFEDGTLARWQIFDGSWAFTGTDPLVGARSLRQSNTSLNRARILYDYTVSGDFEMSCNFQFRAGGGQESIFVLAGTANSDGYEVLFRGRGVNDLRLDRSGTILGNVALDFTPQPYRTYRFRAVRRGSWLHIYIDGRLLMSFADTYCLSGRCGFSTYQTELVVDSFSVRNLRQADRAAHAAWTDTFENGSLTNWLSLAGAWNLSSNTPIAGAASIYQTDTGNDRARIYERRILPPNVALSADVRMLAGAGEEVHLHLGCRSGDSRLECIFRGRGFDDFLLYRYLDGSLSQIGPVPLPFPLDLNVTYRLRAEWNDGRLTAWVGTNNLIKIGTFTPSSELGDGLAGLCTYRTAALFDNVRVEPLTARPAFSQTFGPGTNRVSLVAYDAEGQTATGTVTLVMQPGDTPAADAGGPYSVDELTGQVAYNGWLVTLDGRGSTDPTSPTNRLAYLWDLGTDTFDSTTVITGKWITSSAGVSQNGALAVAGNGNWGQRYAFTRAPVSRAAGTAFQATITPPGTCYAMVGLKNTGTTYHYGQMPYAFYFHDGDYIEIYEDGTSRGRVSLYTPGQAYELRIDLKAAAGARYYLRPAGAAEWQFLYDSNYGSAAAFLRGLDVQTGTMLLDDLRELAPGQVASWRFYGTGTRAVTLTVTDPTGVADTDTTTVETLANDPPAANAGLDAALVESNAADRVWSYTFNAGGSRDDGGILSYEWDWNYDGTFDPSGDTGPAPVHTWTEPGVYVVALRITDHALQTHIDTMTLTITAGNPPTAHAGGPYAYDEFSGSASNGAWTVALNGGASADAESSLVQYVWTVGEETFDSGAYMREKWFYSSDARITNGVLTFDWLANNNDSGHYCFTRDRFTRARGLRAETRIRFPSTDVQIMLGFKNDNETSTHWNQWVYALHNHNGTLYYVESGTEASLGIALTPNVWYDWRIELKAGSGARYYYKLATNSVWTLVRDSAHSSETVFRRGYHNYHGTFEADSYQEYAAGVSPVYRVYSAGTNAVTLTVWDQALQTHSHTATLVCTANELPVAEAGPDRFGTEANCTEGVWFFTFDAAGSTDDHGLYRYEWDWNYDGVTFKPSGDTTSKVQHAFSVAQLGTNTVALRVTDHVLQQHIDTCFVVLSASEPPVANAGADRTVETGWPLTFDGTASTDDVAVVRYAWDFGDGTAGAGPRPRHIYRSASVTNYTVTLTVYDAAEQASGVSTTRVTVVTSTAPACEAGGPYTGGMNGPPVYFDGSASADDGDTNVVQGVAKYLWDVDTARDSDGDGIPDNDVDLVGRRPFHSYTNAGLFTAKLTVVDAAGQSAWDLTTVSVASNLPPHVICVPLHGNPDSPHLVYPGRAVTLKAIVRDAGALTYRWDFGDGSSGTVATVTDKFAIEATHAYSGPTNKPYTARLTVWDSAGLAGSDEYRLVMRPESLATRSDIAVDEALWWLHKNQDRDAGYWKNPTANNAGYRPAAASGAVQALMTNGHRPDGDPAEDPYVETVNRGFDYLFSTLQIRTLSVQPAGNPDTNGNGIGLEVNTTHRGYQQGMVIDAVSSTQDMLGMARTGIAGVKHAFYFDLVTDMVDALIFGQCDPSASDRGGWRYDWNQGTSDNSISQWGAVGLLAAADNFGIQTPAWVKDENKRWLAYSFVNGAYCYRPAEQYPWGETSWHATQPSAMIQMAVVNIFTTNETWKTAEATIADNWTGVYGNAANRNYYALYALVKAMRLARPRPVTYFAKTFLDWYHDPSSGVQQKVVAHQAANGSWSAWYRDNGESLNTDLSTAWAVMMLTPTLFSQAPVPVITAPNVWGYGVPLRASAENSFHIDSARTITRYEWDFDGDGTYDYTTVLANDPGAVWTYPDPTPGVPGDPPATFTIRLRVTDDNTPAQTALATFAVTIAEPPHAPYANAGGPYEAVAGFAITLDGSRSIDIDPTDYITKYEWDLDLDETPDLVGPAAATNHTFQTPGTFNIALRVTDNGVMNNGTNLVSEWHYTTVQVASNLPPVAVPGGPYNVLEDVSLLLDGSASYDPNRLTPILSWRWDFDGDGAFDATGQTARALWPTGGVFGVRLVVSDGKLSGTNDATVAVTPVNDTPTFIKGTNTVHAWGETPYVFPGWASGISAGPSDEAGQALTFVCTPDRPGFFRSGPTIAPDGTLSYTPILLADGTATVSVVLYDNGGTAHGGVDRSASQTFAIRVIGDTDGDGIHDAYELRYWGDLSTAHGGSDRDSDGFPDVSEYLADTDPTNAVSRLVIESIAPFTLLGAGVDITWQSVTTRLYRVERSTNLRQAGGGFSPFTNNVPGEAGSTTITDPAPPGPRVFYRISTDRP